MCLKKQIVLIGLVLLGIFAYPSFTLSLPNLTPYQPSGWSDKIVVSTVTGTTTDSSILTTNDTLYVDFAYRNIGTTATTQPFFIDLHLDGELEDWKLHTSNLSSGYYNYRKDLSIGKLSAGFHTLTVYVDNAPKRITESNETDNIFTKTILVYPYKPNLKFYKPPTWSDKVVVSTVTGTFTDSPVLGITDTLYVDWTYWNNGVKATGSGWWYSTLSVDGVVQKTKSRYSSLGANKYSYFNDVPIGPLSAGYHTLTVKLDSTNSVSEILETDNTFTKTIYVTGPVTLPNLIPYKYSDASDKIVVSTVAGTRTDSSVLTAGDTLYVDLGFGNIGTGDVNNQFVTSLSVDGVYKTGCYLNSLPKNYAYKCLDNVIGSLSSGSHTITMVVDYFDVITESNEGDNTYTKTITVIEGVPDLTPFKPSSWSDKIVIRNALAPPYLDSSVLTSTDPLWASWSIKNMGDKATLNTSSVQFFIDGALRQQKEIGSVGAGIDTSITNLSIGSLRPGSHTLKIVVDSGNVITESDETNNEYSKTISIVPACVSFSTVISTPGAGIISKSLEPSCPATSSSSNVTTNQDLSFSNDHSFVQQVTKKESINHHSLQDLKTKALSPLMAKAEAKGRIRVIVGLRTDGQSNDFVQSFTADSDDDPLKIAPAQTSLLARMSHYNISSVRRFKYIPSLAMTVDFSALERLFQDPDVLIIEEDKFSKPTLGQSVPLIGSEVAWSQGYSGADQAIAILDTGVDKTHTFLEGKVVSEACYSAKDDSIGVHSLCPGGVTESTSVGSGIPCEMTFDSWQSCSHGTHVAGIAAGKGTGFSGVAKDANIIAIKTFTRVDASVCGEDTDCYFSFDSDNIAGLERVYELSQSGQHKIASANLSLGGELPYYGDNCDENNLNFKYIIDKLRNIGIPTIIASGNDGSSTAINHPACISTAISVGSTDDGSNGTTVDSVSSFSNSSPALDLLAPGQWIQSAIPDFSFLDKTFENFNGTSMAAPHVAGAWAVLKSKAATASVDQIFSALKTTGKSITDSRNNLTRPRIQIDAALNSGSLPSYFSYADGTNLRLTATPEAGFQFRNWTGCDSVFGNECTVEVSSGKDVKAVFDPYLGGDTDLIPTVVTGSAFVYVGEELSYSVGFKNQGAANSGPFSIGFYLSTDQTITTEDTQLAVCNHNQGLPAGESSSCNGKVIPSTSLPTGVYFLGGVVDHQGQVGEGVEDNNTMVSSGLVNILPLSTRAFVPTVMTWAGLNNSFFTSELILANKGTQDHTLNYTYLSLDGQTTGTGSDVLTKGSQKIIPDAINYLISRGIPIPSAGNRLGTLRIEHQPSADIGVMVRATTPVSNGRAGLAYPGITINDELRETAYIYGLRQTSTDRSNVALQNLGKPSDGAITLRVTVFSGEAGDQNPTLLPDQTLVPGGWYQHSGFMGHLPNMFVKVERIAGTAPFYAYGVINDQANSDGSFVFPVTESSLVGKKRQTLPVIVETGVFNSELIVTNFSNETKTIDFGFVSSAIQKPDSTATFSLTLKAAEQKIIPNVVEYMRSVGVEGIGPRVFGATFVGALFASVASGDMSGIGIGARTGSPGGGGQYGLFYSATPFEIAPTDTVWIYGLQQNTENRSNLALVNFGGNDNTSSVFALDIYDGETGNLVKTIERTVDAKRFTQINTILTEAPGTTQGYVGVRKISGNNPFTAYGVINDGASSKQRSDDGAYIPPQN